MSIHTKEIKVLNSYFILFFDEKKIGAFMVVLNPQAGCQMVVTLTVGIEPGLWTTILYLQHVLSTFYYTLYIFLFFYFFYVTLYIMLTNIFRVIINNLFKKVFKGKKPINIFTSFFIFYRCCVKIYLKLIVNNCPKGIC